MDEPKELTIEEKLEWLPVSRRLVVGAKEEWDEEEEMYSHTFIANPKFVNTEWLWRRFEEGCLAGYHTYNNYMSQRWGTDGFYVYPS